MDATAAMKYTDLPLYHRVLSGVRNGFVRHNQFLQWAE
jgi:hypothetical protein